MHYNIFFTSSIPWQYQLKCYQCNNYFNLKNTTSLANIFSSCNASSKIYDRRYQDCAITIKQQNHFNVYDITIGCIKKTDCPTKQPHSWKYIHYDKVTQFNFIECCSNKKFAWSQTPTLQCYKENNFPKTTKLLKSGILSPEDHNRLCPGYAENYQNILIDPLDFPSTADMKRVQLDINESANLLITIDKVAELIYNQPEVMNKISKPLTIWDIQATYIESYAIYLRPSENIMIFRRLPHDIGRRYNGPIANGHFFYPTSNSIHICNFTKKAEAKLIYWDAKACCSTVIYLRLKKTTIAPVTTELISYNYNPTHRYYKQLDKTTKKNLDKTTKKNNATSDRPQLVIVLLLSKIIAIIVYYL
jgi:hypothetical protein